MAKNPKQPEIFEWTIQDEAGRGRPEPETPAPAEPPTRPPARRQWLMLAALAALVGLAPWLYGRWDWWRTEQAFRSQIAAEAAPAETTPPLSILRPLPGAAPQLLALERVDQNTLRADVARRYTTPDGATVAFATVRFYQRVNRDWERIAAPTAFLGEVRVYQTPAIQVTYYGGDAELIEDTLVPYLEDLVRRACADWECASDQPAVLNFVDEPRRAGSLVDPDRDRPLLITLLKDGTLNARAPSLGAPHALGYPVAAADLELWTRVIGTHVLTQTARNAVARDNRTSLNQSAFFYALVTRLGARLGLEAESVLGYTRAMTTPVLSEVWQFSATVRAGEVTAALAEYTEQALTVLNTLLREQPAAVDAELLTGLARNPEFPGEAFAWLAQVLWRNGMSANDFFSRMRALTGGSAAARPAPADIDYVLACSPAPLASVRGVLQPLMPWSDAGQYVLSVDWSTDGRRLALNTFLQVTVLDLETGDLLWLPLTDPAADYAFPALWLADTVLAYNQLPAELLDGPVDMDAFKLSVIDLRDPTYVSTGPLGVIAMAPYVQPAPDRSALAWLAGRGPESASTFGSLTLLPGPDLAQPTRIAEDASLPAWSPDGGRLAFAQLDQSGYVSLNLWDAASAETVTLWNSRIWGLRTVGRPSAVAVDWSADGAWIALAVAGDQDTGWLAVVRPDGTNARLLSGQPAQAAAFSRDGRWLAAVLRGNQRSPLLVFSLGTFAAVQQVEGWWNELAWSPRAAQLLFFGEGGAYLLPDPLSAPERLSSAECQSGAWRPEAP